MKKYGILFLLLCFAWTLPLQAQQFSYKNPKTYILSGLKVEGAAFSNRDAVISLSGLAVGEPVTIPGLQISEVIKRLWNENIFSDVNVRVEKIEGEKAFLIIEVKERPRISQFSFQGISKSHAEDLREKINFIRGTILTESKEQSAKRIIRNFYVEKGFYNLEVDIESEQDKILKNGVTVNIKVKKGSRIKIKELRINGNEAYTDKKVRTKMKKVHQKTWWRFWARSKYFPKEFRDAKDGLITFYNDNGYRDRSE
ncbi:MAG: POTRA domain-containing protein, partial [Bacteroidota bacterium]